MPPAGLTPNATGMVLLVKMMLVKLMLQVLLVMPEPSVSGISTNPHVLMTDVQITPLTHHVLLTPNVSGMQLPSVLLMLALS